MNCTTARNEILETSKEISFISFAERKSYNEQANDFLDRIINLKHLIKEKTQNIVSINCKLESLTWLSNLDDECLLMISDIIANVKELHSLLIHYYTKFDSLRIQGIAKAELKEFKSAIDDLKEINTDVEQVFFMLPSDKSFQEISSKFTQL
jgi:hypothetical protein